LPAQLPQERNAGASGDLPTMPLGSVAPSAASLVAEPARPQPTMCTAARAPRSAAGGGLLVVLTWALN